MTLPGFLRHSKTHRAKAPLPIIHGLYVYRVPLIDGERTATDFKMNLFRIDRNSRVLCEAQVEYGRFGEFDVIHRLGHELRGLQPTLQQVGTIRNLRALRAIPRHV